MKNGGANLVENNRDKVKATPDMEAYAHSLAITNSLREPVIRSAIQALQLPEGTQGLDAGCGIGLQAILLAEAAGQTGHVTGLDISSELLDYAVRIVEQAGLSERITLKLGSVSEIPFNNDTFDWVWSADLVGYAPIEPLPLIKELVRVVRPGGIIAILAWSSENLLPGYPKLEARLKGTTVGVAPFSEQKKPETHFMRALGWLHEAGIIDAKARTFAGDVYAPLNDDLRDALTELLQMRWSGVESEITPEDNLEYQRLCTPQSMDFILNQSDYYAFFTYSMFSGVVPG